MNDKVGGDFITFKYRYRKQIMIGIIILLLIIGTVIAFYFYFKEEKNTEPLIVEERKPKKNKKTEKNKPKEVKVDIKGAINQPGIYTLNDNSRVIDVIEKAGGLTDNADTSVINLSKKIMDEMVIIIYTKAEVREFEKTKEKEALVQERCNQQDENALINDACIDKSNNISGKISINKASIEELMTLNGIGESKAKDIISYREKNGPFKSIEDLTKVPGIGEATFAQIKENLTL